MRKLKLEVQLSIDGFAADIQGKTNWMIWHHDLVSIQLPPWANMKKINKYYGIATRRLN